MSFYGAVNDFFIRHIAEIGFIIISLVYIFFYKYIFIISERIFRGITFSLFENRPIVLRTIGFVDSFIIFILTLIFIIPLIKKILHDFIEPALSNDYLTLMVVVFFVLSYLYYLLVYRKHLREN